jgi:hypothetical protein
MINKEEMQEYEDYLQTLSESELKIELDWLKSVGEAKKRGSMVSCIENDTLQ